MNTQLVSIIIPTFNRSSFLKQCIDAILKQTYKSFELIIVDDGSTDDTIQILAHYQHQLQVIQQENMGVSAARNAGIAIAKGDYIAFCDSDDFWLPKKLEKQIAIFTKYPDTMLCYTNEIWIRKGVRVNPKKKHAKTSGWIWERCLELCVVSPSSIIMRREFFDTIGNFDETLPACEDYDLWLRASMRYPFHFIEEPLIIKNGGHEDQLSQKYWGMDRFRVQALLKLLQNQNITAIQKEQTITTIVQMCAVLVNGFRKRNKHVEAEKYQKIIDSLEETK